jgi:putative aldouronate transport system substrate-binding protein
MARRPKLISLILCIAIIFGLTSCSTDTNSAYSHNDADESGDSRTVSGTAYSSHITVSLATIQVQEGSDYNNGDDLVSSITDKFNIDWDITSLSYETWAERLRVWINSDDMPDWIVWNYINSEAVTYARQGLVKKLPDNWKTRWPDIAEATSKTVMSEKVDEELGGTFYLFRPVFSENKPCDKLSTHMSLYLRQDWADDIGYELKDSMKWSEIIDYAEKVKELNPGGVTGNFYPIEIKTANMYVVQNNSTYCGMSGTSFYKDTDGTYKWGGASADTLTGLKLYKKMYDEGLLDSEFYTLQDFDDLSYFSTAGTSAVACSEGMAARMAGIASDMKANLDLDFDSTVRVVTTLGEDGYYHGAAVTNYWCVNAFSPRIDDEKLERVLDVMDWSCTEEGQDLIRRGIKGVDWDEDSEGNKISLLEKDENVNSKYAIHPVYGNMVILSDDFQFINPNYKKEYRDKVKEMYKLRESLSTEETLPSEPDWNVQFYVSTNLNLANMTYYDEYAQLVTKEGDIEENWKQWVQDKMGVIQPVLDELNGLYGDK